MKHLLQHDTGFTIIEVILFLAISGTLAVGILASSSISINTQRYRDATNSLQSTLQQQYNQTSHVLNDRSGITERCTSSGITTNLESGGEPRGASECLVMGRYVAINNAGEMRLSNILAYKTGDTVAVTDTQELKNYDFFVDSSAIDTDEVAWGGTITVKDNQNNLITIGNDQALTIAILRSPLTGVTRTFSFTASQDLTKIDASSIARPDAQDARKICIDPTSFTIGTKLGVLVREKASSSGAIEMLNGDNGC